MSHDPKAYYSRLGLTPAATATQIKAAYRRLAKELHPDVNAGHDAGGQFKAIGEAYSVLSNADKRAAYDRQSYTDAPDREAQAGRAKLEPIACSQCRQVTAQPRYVVFRRVISLVLATQSTPVQGMFCSACARKAALKASLVSSLAGWWGFPWGPILTTLEIGRNAFGGSRNRANEDQLTLHNALAFAMQGNHQLAYALAFSLRSASDPQTSVAAVRLMDHLQSLGRAANVPTLKSAWRLRAQDLLAHAAMVAAVPLAVAVAIYQPEPASAGPTPPPAATALEYTQLESPNGPPAPVPSSVDRQAPALEEPKCDAPPANGAQLAGYATSGNERAHGLEIRNGSSGHAIVKVREAATGRVALSFFVERGDSVAYSGIPDGDYEIQYAVGDALGKDCRSFIGGAASIFPGVKRLQVETKESPEGLWTSYARLSYTLYSVPGGNVQPRSIEMAAFDSE